MKEKQFIPANIQIWDKFDLPLYEDIDDNNFLTISDIKQEVDKRITKLATLGDLFTIPQECSIEYKITDHTDKTACIEPIGSHKYLFKIENLAARKKNEKYFDNIIYHELCHILQIETLVDIGIMDYEDGPLDYKTSDKAAVEELFYKNDFHTTVWYSLINKVNSAFNINPPISRFLDTDTEIDLFLESTFKSDERILLPNICIAEYKHHSKNTKKDFGTEE